MALRHPARRTDNLRMFCAGMKISSNLPATHRKWEMDARWDRRNSRHREKWRSIASDKHGSAPFGLHLGISQIRHGSFQLHLFPKSIGRTQGPGEVCL